MGYNGWNSIGDDMTYKYDTKKWYIATRGAKTFNGELDTTNSLTGSFDTITWYGTEDAYTTACKKKGIKLDDII